MKAVLAGAFGHLGLDILRSLIRDGYEVVAADLKEKDIPELKGKYVFKSIDATKPETLKGLTEGADVVLTTMGLVGKSATLTNYDIDLNGNAALLDDAKANNVKKFIYVSVIHCDSDPTVPMLDAKHKFEEKLIASGLAYTIVRPTGYFYDIAHVFQPMIEKGKVTLLGRKDYPVNVIDTPDLADFIVSKIPETENKIYSIGGKETYTYEEIAKLFFQAAGKKVKISRAPVFLFDMIIKKSAKKHDGTDAIVRFSKWTLTHAMVGDTVYGSASFKEYVNSLYAKKETK